MGFIRVPVLTYHGANVSGTSYAENDGVALREDLDFLHERGWGVVPLGAAVAALFEEGPSLPTRSVVLTCDDATDLDWRSMPNHPTAGHQPALIDRLRDFQSKWGADAQPGLHLTAFAIASRAARRRMSEACLKGLVGMNDSWWRTAEASGMLSIENHSWDHNHGCLGPAPLPGLSRGHFDLDRAEQAWVEVGAAQRVLGSLLGRPPRFFAYPYGPASDFLSRTWLPRHGPAMGLRAAFTTEGAPVEAGLNRWALPRYVCG